MGLSRRALSRSLARLLVGTLTLAGAAPAAAEAVVCQTLYGGETQQIVARPVASPYAVEGVAIGSYFRLRVVVQDEPADIASIKVYTYAERNDEQVLIHQATFPYPPQSRQATAPGFSGVHTVYEPRRGGELQYWCAFAAAGAGR